MVLQKTLQSFGESIRNGIIMMERAKTEQEQLAKKIREFDSNT